MELDLDVPPVSSCLVCGQFGCGGCAERAERASKMPPLWVVPFEQPGLSWGQRLIQTAVGSTLEPGLVFGRGLRHGGKLPAFLFGLAAEFLALGSLFASIALMFAGLFPHIARELAVDPRAWLLGLLLQLVSVGFLLFVHWLWGVALDVGAKRPQSPSELAPRAWGNPAPADRELGVRFGMYACGWDLITSPAGLVVLLVGLPRGTRSRAFGDALRAPRVAMRVYFREALGLPEPMAIEAERRAARQGILWLVGGLVIFLAAAFLGLFYWVRVGPL
jgi:hypothetical protein